MRTGPGPKDGHTHTYQTNDKQTSLYEDAEGAHAHTVIITHDGRIRIGRSDGHTHKA